MEKYSLFMHNDTFLHIEIYISNTNHNTNHKDVSLVHWRLTEDLMSLFASHHTYIIDLKFDIVQII